MDFVLQKSINESRNIITFAGRNLAGCRRNQSTSAIVFDQSRDLAGSTALQREDSASVETARRPGFFRSDALFHPGIVSLRVPMNVCARARLSAISYPE